MKKSVKIKAEYRKMNTRNAKPPVARWTREEIEKAKREAAALSKLLGWRLFS
jgi:hypothetical protein